MESVQEPGVSPSPSPLPVLVHDLGSYKDSLILELIHFYPKRIPANLLQDIEGSNDDDDSQQTQYSISSEALTRAAFDELRQYRCFETPQGWVLALDSASSQTFLWRPQDGERIQLPPKEQGFPEHCKCLLSDMPGAASGCAVVVFDLDHLEMWVCKIGATHWDSHRYDPTTFVKAYIPEMKNIAKCHGIAAVGGKIYFQLTGYELGVIEFNGKEGFKIGTIEVDMVDLPLSHPVASKYLVESFGELFLVVIFFDGYNVHKMAKHAVYKMDFSQPAWCEVDEIGGDRVFLLSGDRGGISRFGASCSAGNRLRGNCIYFLNHWATNENFLHVIDLKEGTEQVQRPFKHHGYLMPVRSPFWLLPTECNSQAPRIGTQVQLKGSSFLPWNLRPCVKRDIVTLFFIFFFVFLFQTMY